MADLVPEHAALPDDHQTAVGTTWSLSVELANQLNPVGVARPVLELLSVLDADGVPASVLTAPAGLAYLSRERAGRKLANTVSGDIDELSATDALRCLHRLSLVVLDPNNRRCAVRVHALVQRAVRETLSDEHLERAVQAAADSMVQTWPSVELDLELEPSRSLRANAIALYECAGDLLWQRARSMHPVLARVVESMCHAGMVAAAKDYARRILHDCLRLLGADHPDTLSVRGSLAHWQGVPGDPVGAAADHAALLADRNRVLGPDHPDTLATRHSLVRQPHFEIDCCS